MENNTTDHERVNLEAHVDLCSLRYASLDKRLKNIEDKVDGIHNIIDDFKNQVISIAVRTGMGIVGFLAVTVWAIKF